VISLAFLVTTGIAQVPRMAQTPVNSSSGYTFVKFRDIDIKIVSILLALGAILLYRSGFFFLYISLTHRETPMPLLVGPVALHSAPLAATHQCLLATAYAICAIGIWRLRLWSWSLAMLLICYDILGTFRDFYHSTAPYDLPALTLMVQLLPVLWLIIRLRKFLNARST
jgi:hypothetical protein